MEKQRKDFIERIKNIKVEKEPSNEGVELTDEFVQKQIKEYREVLNSNIYKSLCDKEGR